MYLPGHARGYDDFHLGGFHLIALDGNFTLSVESCEDAPWVWYESLIPDEERRWLRDRLEAGREPVVVLCHQNLDDRGGDPHLVRNGGQIRSLLAGSGRVRAVVQGHCHGGRVFPARRDPLLYASRPVRGHADSLRRNDPCPGRARGGADAGAGAGGKMRKARAHGLGRRAA